MNCRPFVAVALLFSLCFSCKAQSPTPSILEPAPGSPISMNCSPGNITAADLNKDGKPDLVVCCAQKRMLTLLKGSGDGRFDTSFGAPILLPYPPHEIVTGDMNGDGNADLVVGSHDSYGILILPGDGKGNFTVNTDSIIMRKGSQPHTHGLGIADMNGDGLPDLITANSSDHDVAVSLNDGKGKFVLAPASPFAVGRNPYPLTIGDVNQDGHPDILCTSIHSGHSFLTILSGDGKGNFKRNDIPLRTTDPWFVSIGDINKDQVPDLIMTHAERSEMTVLIGKGGGRFTETKESPYDLGNSAWHIALADVNHDGNPDALAAANRGVRVMLGNGKGQFAAAPGSPYGTGRGNWHLAVSDLNNDSKPDIVTSNLESNNVSVLLGR